MTAEPEDYFDDTDAEIKASTQRDLEAARRMNETADAEPFGHMPRRLP